MVRLEEDYSRIIDEIIPAEVILGIWNNWGSTRRKVNLLNELLLLFHMNLPTVCKDGKGRVGRKRQLSKQVKNYILCPNHFRSLLNYRIETIARITRLGLLRPQSVTCHRFLWYCHVPNFQQSLRDFECVADYFYTFTLTFTRNEKFAEPVFGKQDLTSFKIPSTLTGCMSHFADV